MGRPLVCLLTRAYNAPTLGQMTVIQRVRLSPEDNELLKFVAQAARLDVSTWIRTRAVQVALAEKRELNRLKYKDVRSKD